MTLFRVKSSIKQIITSTLSFREFISETIQSIIEHVIRSQLPKEDDIVGNIQRKISENESLGDVEVYIGACNVSDKELKNEELTTLLPCLCRKEKEIACIAQPGAETDPEN